ncbi:hypothetical protein VD0002_g7929 [Verticillium dahliae]|uniref:Uncharacterized protein n=1 Tax=Verticillium dahliae TaxID=27337 RepID=A0AA44WS72_VERDA|nr:hypothetical protein BJF96_g669 [Verticillium dahliae]PNH47815.1 hypothetical protein VD0003_g8738 [Verticillium dahliae]PNH59630.1 hypothetical protein VD0002_g7929 [Verticillium dahliae]
MATEKQPAKSKAPVSLTFPPPYQGQGSYTESPRPQRDVQYILPGGAVSEVETISVYTSAIPQPFLQPAVLQKWKHEKRTTT